MRTKRFPGVIAAMAASVIVTAAVGADATPVIATSPSQPALTDRLQAELQRSNDLRVRIMYSTELVMNDENDLNKGVSTNEVVAAPLLVEQTRGSTDPLVLDLMVQRCRQSIIERRRRCNALDFARRWTEADTQNEVAWLTLSSVQQARGHVDEARTTFLRAAQASAWHDHLPDFARVVIAASPNDGSARTRYAVLGNALGRAGMAGSGLSALETLATFCKEDADVRAACAKIVATMFRDATTLQPMMLAAPFAQHAHVDQTVVAGYQQKADALRWAIRLRSEGRNGGSRPETADDSALIEENRKLEAMVALGERQTLEEELRARHVAEGDAAARYVRTLSASQREQRKAWLAVQ